MFTVTLPVLCVLRMHKLTVCATKWVYSKNWSFPSLTTIIIWSYSASPSGLKENLPNLPKIVGKSDVCASTSLMMVGSVDCATLIALAST